MSRFQRLTIDRHWNLVSEIALLTELRALPAPDGEQHEHFEGEYLGIAVPFKFPSESGVLSFISTTTIFGSPVDVTLQELALETVFPLDEFTMGVMREMGDSHRF